jgi:hypothetical protein
MTMMEDYLIGKLNIALELLQKDKPTHAEAVIRLALREVERLTLYEIQQRMGVPKDTFEGKQEEEKRLDAPKDPPYEVGMTSSGTLCQRFKDGVIACGERGSSAMNQPQQSPPRRGREFL